MQYPATFTPDEVGFVVTFRDIPEAISQGDTEDEALAMAGEALITAMDFYFEDKRQVPAPSRPQKGERLVSLPPSVSAKVLLLNEVLAQNVRPVDLAERMQISKQEVNRLLDLTHATKIDRISDALSVLGKRLDVVVA